jgi:peroxiredoxin
MVMTSSTMMTLGTPLPPFSLPDVVTGRSVESDRFDDMAALLVMFICRHCPFVKHIQAELAAIGRDYEGASLAIVAISSNDAENYPDDGPASLAAMVEETAIPFPLCFDESQNVAKSFGAACTPDFFLFGPDRRLVYRGQLDDSRPGNDRPVTGSDLRAAIDATLAGNAPPNDQQPSIGCNIKWKPGNEPDYFPH